MAILRISLEFQNSIVCNEMGRTGGSRGRTDDVAQLPGIKKTQGVLNFSQSVENG